MKATIYSRGQIVIPAKARRAAHLKEGDVMDVEISGKGCLTLVRLERPRNAGAGDARLVYRKGKPLIVGGPKVSAETIKQLLVELP